MNEHEFFTLEMPLKFVLIFFFVFYLFFFRFIPLLTNHKTNGKQHKILFTIFSTCATIGKREKIFRCFDRKFEICSDVRESISGYGFSSSFNGSTSPDVTRIPPTLI